MLNRSAIILRARERFLQWLASDDAEGIAETAFEEMRSDPHVYLVPEFEDGASRNSVLKSCWAELFDVELEGWMRDESAWPADRSMDMFLDWFEVETFTTVEDMGFGELTVI